MEFSMQNSLYPKTLAEEVIRVWDISLRLMDVMDQNVLTWWKEHRLALIEGLVLNQSVQRGLPFLVFESRFASYAEGSHNRCMRTM